METSRRVAAFVAGIGANEIPDTVRHEAKRSLLNFFGTALEGTHDSAIKTAFATMREFAGPAQARLIGRREKTDALTAAFLNAAAGNVHDFDDTHLRTVIHPTAPVAPALLALAEMQRVDGRTFLDALALGIEFTCRIGNAVSPEHYARGWHITATCGVFGAALAVGRCLSLDADRLVWAMGGALAQASGSVETLGFMAKSVGVGNAARGGLLAGLLAARCYDGPDAPLEGVRGFMNVTGDKPRLEEVNGDLGSRWEALKNIHKPYPCGIVINAVIDGCLELLARDVSVSDIETIVLTGHPLLQQRADRPDVSTGRESQVSAQHAVAATLIFGEAGLAQFTDEAVNDPRVLDFRSRVSISVDDTVPVPNVRMVVGYADGRSELVEVEDARGTDNRPLTDAELEVKFRTLAGTYASDCTETEKLIEAIWSLEAQDDAGDLLSYAVPDPDDHDDAV